LVAFDADPIAAARDGNRGGVDDIADRDNDQLQQAAARGAVGCVLSPGLQLDLLVTGRREASSWETASGGTI
jgi:hypothetical protein